MGFQMEEKGQLAWVKRMMKNPLVRCWFSRGVGNLGEVAGDCGAVDKLGMGAEVVDCGGELLRRAGEIDPNAKVLGKTTCCIIQIERHIAVANAKVMDVDGDLSEVTGVVVCVNLVHFAVVINPTCVGLRRCTKMKRVYWLLLNLQVGFYHVGNHSKQICTVGLSSPCDCLLGHLFLCKSCCPLSFGLLAF